MARDHVLVFAPHPDDETLGCAGVIQQASMHLDGATVVIVTDGENHPGQACKYFDLQPEELRSEHFIELGGLHRQEVSIAMSILGLSLRSLIMLSFPSDHLVDMYNAPETIVVSRATGLDHSTDHPFGAIVQGSRPFTGNELLHTTRIIIEATSPSVIYVPHRADACWDHQILTEFVVRAARECDWLGPMRQYLVHSGAISPLGNRYKQLWPNPPWPAERCTPNGRFECLQTVEGRYPLGVKWPPDIRLPVPDPIAKRDAIESYRTARALDRKDFLLSFVKADEVFWELDTTA